MESKGSKSLLKTIFEEIVLTVPDRNDQKGLRLMVEHLWHSSEKQTSDQAKLVSDMRRELEDLQRKLKQSSTAVDEVKRQRDTIFDLERSIAGLKMRLND